MHQKKISMTDNHHPHSYASTQTSETYFLTIQKKVKRRGRSDVPLRSKASPKTDIDINFSKRYSLAAIVGTFFFSKAFKDRFYHTTGRTCLAGEEGCGRSVRFEKRVEGCRVGDDVHWRGNRGGAGGM
jgi:hypothetical protein